jgi:hypothetical protein
MGIKISSMIVSPSELGHIRCHNTRETKNYTASCSDGEIMATLSHDHRKISCKKRIFCLSDGVEGVYQRYSERDMDAAHYYLLHILYEAQKEEKLLEKISNIARK